jgi:hypothetical protein
MASKALSRRHRALIEKYMLKDGKYNGRVGIYAGDNTLCIDTIGLELTAKSLFPF